LFGNSIVALLLSLPEVLVILVLMALAAHWEALPTGSMTSPNYGSLSLWGRVIDVTSHLAVPLVALVLAALPPLILHARTALIESLDAPFVRSARANGIGGTRLLLRYVIPAMANPMITLFGLSVGMLLSSSLLVEAVSGWPGLGHLLLQSLLQRDLPVVAGAVLLSSVLLVTGNLIADLLLQATDPRLGEGGY
jgi:peptide/nickel transport system permease protein